MRSLPRLLRYAPKAREGTLKLHFYLESIGYDQSALNSINVILSMSRWTINPFYHPVLKDSKKMALEIKKEFNL